VYKVSHFEIHFGEKDIDDDLYFKGGHNTERMGKNK
jgi:hypothetical protein